MFLKLISSVGVQTAMEEMERLEQRGDATPEELEAMAQEVNSKMLLTTWKATRWEVINVSDQCIARPPLMTGCRCCCRPSAVRPDHLKRRLFETC